MPPTIMMNGAVTAKVMLGPRAADAHSRPQTSAKQPPSTADAGSSTPSCPTCAATA